MRILQMCVQRLWEQLCCSMKVFAILWHSLIFPSS
jgi:hypothetical protein